jgi:hypothetical protein
MLVRVFGVFGVILGGAYFWEGISYVGMLLYTLSNAFEALIIYLLFLTWDFLFGLSLIVAGIGVLLLKEWARLMWFGLMPALVLVHLGIIVVGEFGEGVTGFYLVWTSMVIIVAAASWWYLTEDKIRARFSGRKMQQPTPDMQSPV